MKVAPRQSSPAAPNPTQISSVLGSVCSSCAPTYLYTGRASATITRPISATEAIISTSPPNDVGICAAFSVLNFGKSAPNPSARPAIAKVIIVIVKIDTAIMNPLTWSSTSVANTNPTASASSGSVPTQNLDHSS